MFKIQTRKNNNEDVKEEFKGQYTKEKTSKVL